MHIVTGGPRIRATSSAVGAVIALLAPLLALQASTQAATSTLGRRSARPPRSRP